MKKGASLLWALLISALVIGTMAAIAGPKFLAVQQRTAPADGE